MEAYIDAVVGSPHQWEVYREVHQSLTIYTAMLERLSAAQATNEEGSSSVDAELAKWKEELSRLDIFMRGVIHRIRPAAGGTAPNSTATCKKRLRDDSTGMQQDDGSRASLGGGIVADSDGTGVACEALRREIAEAEEDIAEEEIRLADLDKRLNITKEAAASLESAAEAQLRQIQLHVLDAALQLPEAWAVAGSKGTSGTERSSRSAATRRH